MINNDEKILQLKKQIEEKKAKVGKAQKFTPITNCIINFEGVTYNLNIFNSKEQIIPLLVKLNALVISADELNLLDQYFISGYNVQDWTKDLIAKLEFVDRKQEESKLKLMESKLDQLLSNDKKIELELNEIESML